MIVWRPNWFVVIGVFWCSSAEVFERVATTVGPSLIVVVSFVAKLSDGLWKSDVVSTASRYCMKRSSVDFFYDDLSNTIPVFYLHSFSSRIDQNDPDFTCAIRIDWYVSHN